MYFTTALTPFQPPELSIRTKKKEDLRQEVPSRKTKQTRVTVLWLSLLTGNGLLKDTDVQKNTTVSTVRQNSHLKHRNYCDS